MSNTKKLAVIGLYVALLLGSQFALSGIAGVEIITALFLCFCCAFGAGMGMVLATVFSLVRCLIFGFYPTVIILYLVYYNAFALFFGTVGKKMSKNFSVLKVVFITFFAVCFTCLFTLLDDIITPLFYGLSGESALVYFYSSLYILLPQVICSLVTVAVLYVPVTKLLKKYS